VLVSEEDVVLYREWITNNRTLDRVVRQMRKLSAPALKFQAERVPMMATLRLKLMGVIAHRSEGHDVTSHKPLN
jgi:hypothetical protein